MSNFKLVKNGAPKPVQFAKTELEALGFVLAVARMLGQKEVLLDTSETTELHCTMPGQSLRYTISPTEAIKASLVRLARPKTQNPNNPLGWAGKPTESGWMNHKKPALMDPAIDVEGGAAEPRCAYLVVYTDMQGVVLWQSVINSNNEIVDEALRKRTTHQKRFGLLSVDAIKAHVLKLDVLKLLQLEAFQKVAVHIYSNGNLRGDEQRKWMLCVKRYLQQGVEES